MDVADYYADLTQNYLYYGGDANSWHYGVPVGVLEVALADRGGVPATHKARATLT